MSEILDAAYGLVHDYPGGALSLAPRIGKSASTLSHECVASGTAKLGLVDALKLSHLTGDMRILNTFAAACGCVVLPMPEAVAGDTFQELAATAREFGEFIAAVADSAADGRITANELAHIDRELTQMLSASQHLRATLAAMHEAGKPAALRRAA